MCCFTGPVNRVYGTKIFARLDGDRQAIAYAMAFETDQPVAMVLPIPVAAGPESEVVSFVTLPESSRLFEELASGFPVPRDNTLSWGPTARSASDPMPQPLVVHRVGNFVASFVPTMNDFDRLDPVFRIAPETWAQVPGYERFGFVVFQLHELSGEPKPMAFWFKTATPDQVFFPTLHIHDGTIHSHENFDHVLYVQGDAFDRGAGGYTNQMDPNTRLIRSRDPASSFVSDSAGLISPSGLVHRKFLNGSFPNQDTILSLQVPPAVRGLSEEPVESTLSGAQRWTGVGAIVTLGVSGLTGLGWLIWRRNKLRSQSPSDEADESVE